MEMEVLKGGIYSGLYEYKDGSFILESSNYKSSFSLSSIENLVELKQVGEVIFFSVKLFCSIVFHAKASQGDYIELVTLHMKNDYEDQSIPESRVIRGECDSLSNRESFSLIEKDVGSCNVNESPGEDKVSKGKGGVLAFLFVAVSVAMIGYKASITEENENNVGYGYFTEQGICAAGIAGIMGRDISIISMDKSSGGIHYLHYVRPNDKSKWFYKCKIEGDRIIWASNNSDSTGRWRVHELDPIIKYQVTNRVKLTITESYTDDSESVWSYSVFDRPALTNFDTPEGIVIDIMERMVTNNSIDEGDIYAIIEMAVNDLPLAQAFVSFMHRNKSFEPVVMYDPEKSEKWMEIAESKEKGVMKKFDAIYNGEKS